jgi:acyl-[acyl carrier protein]--UDP-N-acetylglucosamine O-acyltransferase
MQLWRRKKAIQGFAYVSDTAHLGKDIEMGFWTSIGAKTHIGDKVELGGWARVGEGSVIGEGAVIGSHAEIGKNAVIGAGAVLPDHVRICDDVVIEPGRVFEGHELVTKEGVIPNRCGSFIYSQIDYDAPVVITGPFGDFEVPAHEFDEDMIDDFMWGDDKLEAYVVDPSPGAEMETPGF